MFKNYVITIFRFMTRHKIHAFINVFSLSIGIACCLLILMFIANEFDYDAFHEKADNIYRVYVHSKSSKGAKNLQFTPPPLARLLKEKYSGIKNTVRLGVPREHWLTYKDKSIKAKVVLTETSIFEVLSFHLENGDFKRALSDLNNAVISRTFAQKIYGQDNPLGKTLTIMNVGSFIITGVLKEIPVNSSLKFDVLINIQHMPPGNQTWSAFMVQTFVLLSDNVRIPELERQFASLVSKHFPERMQRRSTYSLHLQPLRDIYLNPQNIPDLHSAGNITSINILLGISLLIALIACMNFMNLMLSSSSERAKEVGIRKSVGALRMELIKQFLGESFLYSLIALIVGVVLAELLLPTFSDLIGKELVKYEIYQRRYIIGLLGTVLFFGLLSGSYPALVLSHFHPVDIIKGTTPFSSDKMRFRNVLVLSQFSLSIFLFLSAIIMRMQYEFLTNKNLGFNKQQVMALPLPENAKPTVLKSLKTELKRNSNIVNVSGALSYPGETGFYGTQVKLKGYAESELMSCIFVSVDEDYIPLLEMELIAGRNFSQLFTSDLNEAVIVNETFVRKSGLKEPLHKQVEIGFRDFAHGTIIGIVKDFHFKSLLHEIEPTILTLKPIFGINCVLVRLRPENVQESINYLKQKWYEFAPDQPFEYHFLDDAFASQYHFEERWSKIVSYSSIMAISIACMGLIGLVGIIVIKRTKEIGIRKILGASVSNIVLLLTKDFTRLVLAANLIAWPVGYFIMKRWLENYPYQINMKISFFLGAGVASLAVAMITVSFQAIKAALANPVESLRYE